MREFLSTTELQKQLQRERGRADRNGHEFSMLILNLSTALLQNKTARLLSNILFRRIRFTDLAGWLNSNEVALILPDTNASGAATLARDIISLLSNAFPRLTYQIYTYPGDRFEEHHEPPSQSKTTQPAIVERRDGHVFAEASNGTRITAPKTISALQGTHAAPLLQPFPLWKRMMDIFGALAGLVLLSPLLLLIGCAVKLSSPGPILFQQLRLGHGGKPFRMHKFRSMQNGANENVHRGHLRELIAGKNASSTFKLTNDARVTAVGRFIRKWSLDELPQLWNVLVGDMTLVGPRPEPCYAQESFARWYHRRTLEMKPGITGLWQIEGRSRVPYEEMIRMDLRYCQSLSFYNDLKLLLRTFKAVWSHAGAY